jgi:hypothetical protein
MGTTLIKNRKNGANLGRLTDKQRMFVLELLASNDFCPTRAARAAGYKSPSVQAFQLLNKPAIQAALGKAQREREERCEVRADLVLQEVAYCALRDPIDLCDEDGRICVDDLRKLPERIRRCIDSFKIKRRIDPETGEIEDSIELRLAPKIASLELAMKHLGLLTERKEISLKGIDWEPLYKSSEGEPDLIEQKVLDVGK